MSVCRKLPDGTIQKIAGHTILLDVNASEIRTGTFALTVAANQQAQATIEFSDPMPDVNYIVVFEEISSHSHNFVETFASSKTTTGFRACVTSVYPSSLDISYRYYAWKPVKIEGYTELQNKVNNPDDTPTIGSMNLVTSDGVARAIENASAVWKGTKAEWTALPAADKVKYDLAVLLDKALVKAIDRTDGTETNVADLSGQFVGTHAEWEAESDKTQYKTAVLTDDRKTVNEVTGTGALNEVADDARIWRGTKAEWEALSSAEKDEWDQAEIETIEAQGLNPFRTLSDPETLSIAPNTDYTFPHDGFIILKLGSGQVYINGVVVIAPNIPTSGGRETSTLPVQKGDIFKYNSSDLDYVKARWYTTDINPGNPIDYPVVHRSQSLDWSNKVAISNAELQSGWTATGDGFFVCCNLPKANDGGAFITLNNTKVGFGIYNDDSDSYIGAFNVQIPVVKGDVLKSTRELYAIWSDTTWFVPYKDYPDYSTTEHWTGRRWIDGKKIYSKVIDTGNLYIDKTWRTVAVGIENVERFISGQILTPDNAAGAVLVRPVPSSTNCMITMPGVETWHVKYLIVEYIKTTDD